LPSFSTITMYVLVAGVSPPSLESVVPVALSFVPMDFFAVRSKIERRESSVDGGAFFWARMMTSKPFPFVPLNV
jgi:hypothetical protein